MQRHPLEGLEGKIHHQFDDVEVETFFVSKRCRLTVGSSSDDGPRLFVLAVGDEREVLGREQIRSLAAALRGLAS